MFNTIYNKLIVLNYMFQTRTQELECVHGHTYKITELCYYYLRYFITLGF